MDESSQPPVSPTSPWPPAAVAAGTAGSAILCTQHEDLTHASNNVAVSWSNQRLLFVRCPSSSDNPLTSNGRGEIAAGVSHSAPPVVPRPSAAVAFHTEAPPSAKAGLFRISEAPVSCGRGVPAPSPPISPPPLPFNRRSTVVPRDVVVPSRQTYSSAVRPAESVSEEVPALPQPLQSALHASAGAAGALLSMVCVYPLDYVRTVQSVRAGGSESFITLAKKVVSREGWHGLYRGLRSALWGMVVSWGVYFFVYNHLKKKR